MIVHAIMPEYNELIGVSYEVILMHIDLITIILAYLIGCFSMSHLISKVKGINLKEQGSKNYGASNTLALIGKRAGAAVLISDILKVIIAVLLCRKLNTFMIDTGIIYKGIPHITLNVSYDNIILDMLYGVSAILGHIFPMYLKFKGGKGFASYIGLLFVISFRSPTVLIILMIALIMAVISNYIVAATFTVITLTPIYVMCTENIVAGLVLLIVSLIIFMKHFENIEHIKDGTEMKIREAFKNKYKHEK